MTMENHHLLWILPWIIAIFHSYVKLPEGNWDVYGIYLMYRKPRWQRPRWQRIFLLSFSDASITKSVWFPWSNEATPISWNMSQLKIWYPIPPTISYNSSHSSHSSDSSHSSHSRLGYHIPLASPATSQPWGTRLCVPSCKLVYNSINYRHIMIYLPYIFAIYLPYINHISTTYLL
jgi:hypothetical protein